MAEEPSAAAAVAGAVEDEVGMLVQEILRISGGKPVVTYGELAKDDRVSNTFEALLGTLKAARKRGIVSFEGELLLMGQHDDVVISLVGEESAAPAAPAQPAVAAKEEVAEELAEEPAPASAASSPAKAAPAEAPEPAVAAPAQPEPAKAEEEAGDTAVAEEELPKPSEAVPPPAAAPPPAPAAAETPAPATAAAPAPAAAATSPDNKDEKKGWNVDTSYIDYRTGDPDRLESRRSDDNLDRTPADAATAAAGAAAVAASSAATKGEDGRWQQVDVSYINHRTGEVDNLEPRRAKGEAVPASAPLSSPAVAPGPSSTVKKEDGKWTVDTSYINHRTGDTANLTRKEEAADAVAYADPAATKYPYEALKGARPADVDPAKKELYLDDAEFLTVMGMTVPEFQKMPKWKQQNLKKAKEIF